MTYNRSFLIFF